MFEIKNLDWSEILERINVIAVSLDETVKDIVMSTSETKEL